jgi:hypothetical protein
MELTREEKLGALERLLQSRTLHGSESLKAFLNFVVHKAVDDQISYLKEYTIATEVFGRRSNYDSRSDSSVRVQAGRLRSKLQEYYSTEGKDDRVLIDLPKGKYTPVFSHTAAAHRDPHRELPQVRADESAGAEALLPFWESLLGSSEPILVSFSNTLFQGTAETGMRLLKPLDSPARNLSSAGLAQGLSVEGGASVLTTHYTGIGEAMGIYLLADLLAKARQPFRVKRSLLLTWEDLKTENIIVLGSPAENLLMRELPQEQDFIFKVIKDENNRDTFGIVNTRPQPAEQPLYLATQEGPSRSEIAEDYALISLLSGLDSRHRLLILAGITTFGTQAAAEYVTQPQYARDLITHINTAAAGEPPRLPACFQALVRVRVNGGVPVQVSYVTHHVL